MAGAQLDLKHFKPAEKRQPVVGGCLPAMLFSVDTFSD